MSTWTQAMCDSCWKEREGDRIPHRMKLPDEETCSLCGHPTRSGIYFRINPREVPYPRKVD